MRLVVMAVGYYRRGMTGRQHHLVLMYGLTPAEARALTGGPPVPSGRPTLTPADHHLHASDARQLRRALRRRSSEFAQLVRRHVAAGVPWQALAEAVR